MTVRTSKPALNLREELASLRNQGGYQEQQFWMDGLVTNGTFDANIVGWTSGGGGSIAFGSNAINITTTDATDAYAYQAISVVVGQTYKWQTNGATVSGSPVLSFRVGTSIGGFQLVNQGVTPGSAASGTFVATVSLIYVSVWNRADVASSGSFDNISVFETDGTNVVHRLPKGWKPKDVFEDGLLQREGAAHDYTVVYDGFDYFVKPAVAPSATTQTCVIGVKA